LIYRRTGNLRAVQRLMSEVPGQSGHALPGRPQPLRAKTRRRKGGPVRETAASAMGRLHDFCSCAERYR
jgi:hypothetical protein